MVGNLPKNKTPGMQEFKSSKWRNVNYGVASWKVFLLPPTKLVAPSNSQTWKALPLRRSGETVNPVLNDSQWQIKYEQSFGEVVSMSQIIAQQWRRQLVGTGAGTDFLNFLAAGLGDRRAGGAEGFWAWRSLLVSIYGLLFYEFRIRLCQRLFVFTATIKCKTN